MSDAAAVAASKSPSEIAFDDDLDSGPEKCGFVCHVLVSSLAVTYTAWIVSYAVSEEEAPAWTTILPAAAICLFFATPILYGATNAVAATPSAVDALETIQDRYTVKPPRNASNSSHGYFRDPMESSSEINTRSSISEICDIDVADINDLVVRSSVHVR